MRSRISDSAMPVLLVVLAACGHSGGSDPGGVTPVPMQDLTLTVTNQDFYDATVYLMAGSNRLRLGIVPSNDQATFTFPWGDPRIRFQIVLQSAGSYLTEYIAVSAGDALQYTIPPDAHRRVR